MSLSLVLVELDKKHPGITSGVGGAYCEAARVCLDRHHAPPHSMTLTDNGVSCPASIAWAITDARLKAAWANTDDATRDGAYAVAITAVEATRGLVAVARAETKSGADYYLDAPNQPTLDLETAVRLEVSGLDKGNATAVNQRLKEKVQQAQEGKSSTPAIATVVGFATSLILTKDV